VPLVNRTASEPSRPSAVRFVRHKLADVFLTVRVDLPPGAEAKGAAPTPLVDVAGGPNVAPVAVEFAVNELAFVPLLTFSTAIKAFKKNGG
jgi:hypothetical protein